jgi:hypothetical protein
MFNLRFATSSDQLEDKTAFEKEARSVISLMQLPLTGVFNRLTLSVCRATIDTQVTFSRVFLFVTACFTLLAVTVSSIGLRVEQQRAAAASGCTQQVSAACSTRVQSRPSGTMILRTLEPAGVFCSQTRTRLASEREPRSRRFHGS